MGRSQKGWTVEGDYKIHSDLQYADIRRWRRLMGMKQILVMIAAVLVVGQSVVADEKLIADPIVEKAVRKKLKKPEGKLTEADLGNVIELILTDTQITDEGLKEMAKLQRLETLQLSYTRITDAGIKEVAKSQQLGSLFLTDTQITDAGIKDVAKLQKLKMLRIRGTKVTKVGVAELKEALPNCIIYGP